MLTYTTASLSSLKPRTNGRNIVGQQLPAMLDVTCCVRFHTLLHVVACYWEFLRKVWNRLQFWTNNSQHFFRSVLAEGQRNNVGSTAQLLTSNIVRATHAHYTCSPKSYGLYPSHVALQIPTLLGVVASVCTPLPTRTQQLPALLAQHCWRLLRRFARSFTPTMHSVGQRRNCCNRLSLDNRLEFWNHICVRGFASDTLRWRRERFGI